MTPFFIPFIFGRRGGSRRIGHVTPTPIQQEDKPAERAAATELQLSPRELRIIAELDKQAGK